MSSTFLNSFPAKVLRILLVFVLTFGMTLHVEYFAFAAGADSAKSTGSSTSKSSSKSSSSSVEVEPEVTDIAVHLDKAQGTVVATDSEGQVRTPEIDEHQGSIRFAVTAAIDKDGDTSTKDVTSDITWDVDDPYDLITFDKSAGLATATGKGNGTAVITATLKKADAQDIAKGSTAGFECSFELEVSGQVPVYVTSIQILDSEGNAIPASAEGLVLDADSAKSYQLLASVGVHDATGALAPEYTLDPGETLADITGGELDLEWSVDRAADISSAGVLKMTGPGTVQVTCEASIGVPGQQGSTEHSVFVTVEAEEEPESSSTSESESESSSSSESESESSSSSSGSEGESSSSSGGESSSSGSESSSSSSSESSSSSSESSSSSGGEAPEPTLAISLIEILQEDGTPFAQGQALELDSDEETAYAFGARVTLADEDDNREAYVRQGGVWTKSAETAGDADPDTEEDATSETAGDEASEGKLPEALEAIEWKLTAQEGEASISAEGVLTIAPGATATVQCAGGGKEDTVEVKPKETDPEQKQPYLKELQILKEDGSAFADGESLNLEAEAAGESGATTASTPSASASTTSTAETETTAQARYRFGVKAVVALPAAEGEEPEGKGEEAARTVEYVYDASSKSWNPAGGQGEGASEFEFGALEWSVVPVGGDASAAAIDETGALTIAAGTTASVKCACGPGEGGKQVTDSLDVAAGAPEKKADERYISKIEILKDDGTAFGDDETLKLSTGAAAATGGSSSSARSTAGGADGQDSYSFGARAIVTDPATRKDAAFVQTAGGWVPEAQAESASSSSQTSTSTASGGESDNISETFPFTVSWSVSPTGAISENGELTLPAGAEATVTCSSASGPGGAPVADSVTVNPGDQEEAPEQGLHLSYIPVPEGETAFVSSFVAGISNITYITHWEENDGSGWTETEPRIGEGITGSQNLERPTVAPYIGRQYRAYIEVIGGSVDGATSTSEDGYPVLYSEPVTISVAKDGLSVRLDVKYVAEGQDAWFTTTVRGTKASETVASYTWYEWNTANEKTELANGYVPTYSILTDRAKYGYRYQVHIETSQGRDAWSNIQMLAALDSYQNGPESENPDPAPSSSSEGDGETEGGSSSSTGSESGSSSSSSKASSSTSSESAPASSSSASSASSSASSSSSSSASTSSSSAEEEPPSNDDDQPTPDEPHEMVDPAETLSQQVDRTGQATVSFDDGSTAVMKPAGSVKMANDSKSDDDIVVDPQVSEEVSQLRQEQREVELSSQPGARWNPLTFKNTTPELQEVLESNPFAPLVLPFVLGLLAAGALEKYLRYREQKRPSQAVFR